LPPENLHTGLVSVGLVVVTLGALIGIWFGREISG
jgi:uncharacterized membrane protein